MLSCSSSSMAGMMMLFSSSPHGFSSSPVGGLSASTAIRGFEMRRSRRRQVCSIFTFSTTMGLVMASGTSLMASRLVTRATRRSSIILTRSTSGSFDRKSGRLSGPMTSTSASPCCTSTIACFRALRAASVASSDDCPISTLISSSKVVSRFSLFSLASSAALMTLNCVSSPRVLRW